MNFSRRHQRHHRGISIAVASGAVVATLRGMGEHVAYWSDWRTREFRCQCGWTGTGDHLASGDFFAELQEMLCPSCHSDQTLALVIFPTEEDTRAAAERGNEEARNQLASIDSRNHRRAIFERAKLVDGVDLPDVDGPVRAALVVEEGSDGGDSQLALLLNGDVVHREPAWFEDTEPVGRIGGLLVRRYGGQLEGISLKGAMLYLAGDRLASPGECRATLNRLGIKDLDVSE